MFSLFVYQYCLQWNFLDIAQCSKLQREILLSENNVLLPHECFACSPKAFAQNTFAAMLLSQTIEWARHINRTLFKFSTFHKLYSSKLDLRPCPNMLVSELAVFYLTVALSALSVTAQGNNQNQNENSSGGGPNSQTEDGQSPTYVCFSVLYLATLNNSRSLCIWK